MLFPKLNNEYWGKKRDYERETFSAYAVLGCCFMFSRQCALEVTPLDATPFLYEEELILGIVMEQGRMGDRILSGKRYSPPSWKQYRESESVCLHLQCMQRNLTIAADTWG